ncbi:MAG TPA: BTAD domain-containing putative transcriptional regulator [Jatrophihabitantaceae bacterium]
MEDRIRFRLLGPLTVTVDGTPVPVPGAAERALLVLLLLSPGRLVTATSLIDRLWAESKLPADPLNALQLRVSKLRRALASAGVPSVVREPAGYRLDVDSSTVDTEVFVTRLRAARTAAAAEGDVYTQEHLDAYDRALEVWAGEPLPEFATERWANAEAARLSEMYLAAVTERAQVALDLGRAVEVVTDLDPIVTANPTLEALAGLLMTALYRTDRQADALEVYSRTRRELDEILGLEPSASLRSLHQRVLRQDPSLSASAATGQLSLLGAARRSEDRAAPHSNLPVGVRPLIGRDDELGELDALLMSSSRLVSLVGPGGAGKTSLALAAALQSANAFPDGAMMVRLAPVSDPTQVPVAVADAIGAPLDGAAAVGDIRDRLAGFLNHRHMLLLIDNCEHVVDSAAALVEDLLARCRHITVLTTSREALAIPEELQFLVGPLDTPPENTPPSNASQFPAVQLFVVRALARRHGLVLDDHAWLAIARVCRELDGIPLAIELAAARVASMSLADIAERLADRFALLTTGPRTAETRQRTLRATVDWSFALLTEQEKTVLLRLAVFRGGWTLEAAEAVVPDHVIEEADVVDTIARLVERSLVAMEASSTSRYRMLETVREYAAEQLQTSGDHEAIANRHAAYFAGLVDAGDRDLRGHGQRAALARLRDEQPNIRAALSWLRRPAGDLDAALTLAGSLGLFWHLGRHVEGRELLRALVPADTASPEAQARALQAVSLVERPRACLVHPSPRCAETARASLLTFDAIGDRSRAALSRVLLAVEGVTGAEPELSRRLLSEAEEQFIHDGDAWGQAVIGFVRMETALKSGAESEAVSIGRSAAAVFRQLDDPWGLSAVLYHLGWGLRQFGRYTDGARVLEEAIDVAASAGIYNTVQWAHADLGIAHLNLDDTDAARDCFDRARTTSDNVGDGAGAVLADYGYALLAQLRGDVSTARTLYTAALTGFDRLGTPVVKGLALAGLARCDEAVNDLDSAEGGYTEALEIGSSSGEPGLMAAALDGLARIEIARPNHDRAAQLVRQAREIRDRTHRPAPPYEQAGHRHSGNTTA